MARKLSDIDLYKIYTKWFQGCGHFRCFFRATNFVSLKHYPDFVLKRVSYGKGKLFDRLIKIIDGYDKKTTFFIIDLPGEQSIKMAYLLQNRNNIKSVLTFNSPLHPLGFVGGEDYISMLLGYGEKLEHVNPEGYAFILDENRYVQHNEEEFLKRFNNQYVLVDEALPSEKMLRSLGFENVLFISRNLELEDISDYLRYLDELGFGVNKIIV